MNDISQPKRYKSTVRLPFLHYNEPGGYAITIAAFGRINLFGRIEDGQMVANEFGLIVQREWMKTTMLRPELTLDVFCLMPNHFHGIVMLSEVVANGNVEPEISHEANRFAHISGEPNSFAHIRAALPRPMGQRMPRSISTFVGGFKGAVTARINTLRNTAGKPVWQSSFHEHVIRNEQDLTNQREYIQNNPAQWELDEENPDRRE